MEISENKPEGRGGTERPKRRWFKDVANLLRGTNFKRVRQKTLGREEWVSKIKTARVPRWP
jgi:hypothetical protein